VTTYTKSDIAAIQRRTKWTLAGSAGLAGMGMAGGFAATALSAKQITGSAGLATFAATMISMGGAVSAVPLSRYMDRHGRRLGLRWGWRFALFGAFCALLAVELNVFALLIVGTMGIGVGNGTNLAARYSAADLADEDRRARAIGTLVWFAALGSVLGPTLALGPTGWVARQVGLDELSGPYMLGMVVFAIASVTVGRRLHPDPLLLARELGGSVKKKPPSLGQSFALLFRHRLAALAVLAMAIGQAVMVATMTVTPLHMDDGNHEATVIGFVISFHIVGMYFLAPFVGWLVDRLPTTVMVATAGIVLFVGAELAAHTDAVDVQGVFFGLFLIGFGWSFAMISGSSLLTSAFPVHERASVQGAADFTMVASGSIGGLLSGVVVGIWSYHTLAHYSGLLALTLVAAALYPVVTRTSPKPEASAPTPA